MGGVDGEKTLFLRLDVEAHLGTRRVHECERALDVLLDSAVAELNATLGQAAHYSLTR